MEELCEAHFKSFLFRSSTSIYFLSGAPCSIPSSSSCKVFISDVSFFIRFSPWKLIAPYQGYNHDRNKSKWLSFDILQKLSYIPLLRGELVWYKIIWCDCPFFDLFEVFPQFWWYKLSKLEYYLPKTSVIDDSKHFSCKCSHVLVKNYFKALMFAVGIRAYEKPKKLLGGN